MKMLVKLPAVPPVVKEVAKSVAHTALHAAVFSYVGKKVANWVDANSKKRVATDEDK